MAGEALNGPQAKPRKQEMEPCTASFYKLCERSADQRGCQQEVLREFQLIVLSSISVNSTFHTFKFSVLRDRGIHELEMSEMNEMSQVLAAWALCSLQMFADVAVDLNVATGFAE